MKKNVQWHTTLGLIEVQEWGFLQIKRRAAPSHRIHPFQNLTGICNRSYSLRIQRFITDFGAEHSFEMSVKKMQEHHPLAIVLASSARQVSFFSSIIFFINNFKVIKFLFSKIFLLLKNQKRFVKYNKASANLTNL